MSYTESRAIGDKHLSVIMSILERCFANKEIKNIRIATEKEDKEENTDIVIQLQRGVLKIAVRVRTYKKFRPDKFSIRSVTKNDDTCNVEWYKMKQGHGDYFIYASETQDASTIDKYAIFDLDIVREFTMCSRDAPKLASTVYNSDGSGAVYYDIELLLTYDPRALVSTNIERYL